MHILLLLGLLIGGQDSGTAVPTPTPKVRDTAAAQALDAMRELQDLAGSAEADADSLEAVAADLHKALNALETPLPPRPLSLQEMDFDDLHRVGPEIERSRDYLTAWRTRDEARTRAEDLVATGEAIAETIVAAHEQWFTRTVALRPKLVELERRVTRGEVLEQQLGLAAGSIASFVEETAAWSKDRDQVLATVNELVARFEDDREAVLALPPVDPELVREAERIALALSTISEALAAQSELIARLTDAPVETLPAELERIWQEWELRRDSARGATNGFTNALQAFEALRAEREANEVPRAGDVLDGEELYEVRKARRDVAFSTKLIAYYQRDRELTASLAETLRALENAEFECAQRHAAFSRQTARVFAAVRLIEGSDAAEQGAAVEVPADVDAREAWDAWRNMQDAEADRREQVAAARAIPLERVREERLEEEREALRLAELRLRAELSHAEFVATMVDRDDEDLARLLTPGTGIEAELRVLDDELATLEARLDAANADCLAIAEELREIESPYTRAILLSQVGRSRELEAKALELSEGEVLPDETASLAADAGDALGSASRRHLTAPPDGSPLEVAVWEQDRLTAQQEFMRLLRTYYDRLEAVRERFVVAVDERNELAARFESAKEQRVRQLKMRYAAANELAGRIARGRVEADGIPENLESWTSSAEVVRATEELRDWRAANAEFLARAEYLHVRLERVGVVAPIVQHLTESADERASMIGTPVSRMTSALTSVQDLDTVSSKNLQFEAEMREADEDTTLEAMMKRFSSPKVVERFEDPLGAYYLELANIDRVLEELSEAERAYGDIAKTWHEDRVHLLPARKLAAQVQDQRLFDYHAARYAVSVSRFPGARERIERSFRTAFGRALPYRLEVDLEALDASVDALYGMEVRFTAQDALRIDLERLLSKTGIELEVSWYRAQVARVRAMLERARSDQANVRRRIDDLRRQYRARLKENAIVGIAITLCIPIVAWLLVLLAMRWSKRFEYDTLGELGEHDSDRKRRMRTLARTFTAAFTVLIWILAAIYIFAQLGLDVTPLIASASVVGLAVAFGAQALIKDFFYGFFILLENQFTVGDVVRLGDISGTVEKISLRITILRDLKGAVHYIPNGSIGQVSNMTQEWARVVLEISVPYREDPDRASAILQGVLQELYADPEWNGRILEEPVVAGVQNLTDRSIDIRLMIKTRPGRQWEVAREARRRIKQRLDREGIESPFPHRIIHHLNGPTGEEDRGTERG